MHSVAKKPDVRKEPDLFRRYAELLVESGMLSRREVELALREARRARQPLALWLIRNGRVKSQHLFAVRRIETLLVHHGGSPRLADLLLESRELTRGELKRVLETRMHTGAPMGEILMRQGLLGRARKPHIPPLTLLQPLAAAAVLAAIAFGVPALAPSHPASAVLHKPVIRSATTGVDLRFASLGNITPHLKRIRQRPGPYRAPATLTGTTKQRAKKLRPLVNRHAQRYALPPSLILAMIERESSFNPDALSPRKGVGLMQLVPHAGGREAYHYSERKTGIPTLQELRDPNTNIRLGSAYLRLLLDRHFDDIEHEDVRVALALAAYNWGPTRMRRALKENGRPQSMDEVEALLEKHAPRETQNYVREITYRMEAFG
jgi:hypothetical protein